MNPSSLDSVITRLQAIGVKATDPEDVKQLVEKAPWLDRYLSRVESATDSKRRQAAAGKLELALRAASITTQKALDLMEVQPDFGTVLRCASIEPHFFATAQASAMGDTVSRKRLAVMLSQQIRRDALNPSATVAMTEPSEQIEPASQQPTSQVSKPSMEESPVGHKTSQLDLHHVHTSKGGMVIEVVPAGLRAKEAALQLRMLTGPISSNECLRLTRHESMLAFAVMIGLARAFRTRPYGRTGANFTIALKRDGVTLQHTALDGQRATAMLGLSQAADLTRFLLRALLKAYSQFRGADDLARQTELLLKDLALPMRRKPREGLHS